jgi:hypothetical protein
MEFVRRINALIAARLGVRESEVTKTFIHARRTQRKPGHDGTNSVIGGRTTDGLEHLTGEQVASALKTFHHMTVEE